MYFSILARVVCLALALALVLPGVARAQRCDSPVGRAASVQGTVELQRAGATQWQPVQLNDELCPGDTIRALDQSRADVMLLSQSVLRVRANTRLTLEGIRDDESYFVDLLQGAVHFFSRKGERNLEVNTPFTVAGVRGTEFYVGVESERALLTVFKGRVLASNSAGSLVLGDGQSAVAERGGAPRLQVVARPRDAVQWALYYQPVVDVRPEAFQGKVRQSAEHYLQGDLRQAFDSLKGAPDRDDPRFLTYRASMLLAVGSVAEAQADIERALARSANDSNALALRSIIAIARNENGRALEVARRAVQAAPGSASALIALSYAQQASFDLEGARGSLEQSVQKEPENALAWARLAEMRSSFGDLSGALAAAQEAARLQPNLSRTQMVLGFAYLTQVRTAQARSAFERAIALDQADPLSRLGLGLAKIRDGDLEGGGRDVEVAASLDSSSALIRSYLGKTYYEEKRQGLDEREYEVAKQLDPNDPTPWFYSAIAKQTTNRPVEALGDLQKATELNDNRAVYRSRLLLDSDLAARSSSLGRIYGDLGFQQLALVEGWNSVNTDPTNFSAHRLLADSYAALPRHEVARVSELLQSQLLQPANTTSIQPRLAESNLFLISSQGPAALSFNEFNPLFNRNQVSLQASGMRAENDTLTGEGIVSGIYDRASFSFGYSAFRTDGWRANNEQDDDVANAFAQYELSPQTSVQAEYRRRDRKSEDLELRFFETDFSTFFDEDVDRTAIRGGLRHTFSPGSVLLLSYQYQTSDGETFDASPATGLLSALDEFDETSQSGEAQYLFRSGALGFIERVNITAGGGFFTIKRDEALTSSIQLPFPPFPILTSVTNLDADIDHTNFYAYADVALPSNVTVTLGLSADYFNVDSTSLDDESQLNPKFGITWEPCSGTTVRVAAFRALKRTLITNQTLEPTQVAGFNQFFDDLNGTEAWRYGVAVDQKFGRGLFGGVEYSMRALEAPFIATNFIPPATFVSFFDKEDWDEDFGRVYAFWTPLPALALSAEYQWEKLERNPRFAPAYKDAETQRVPLGARYFHPMGLGASVVATYFRQDGEFENRGIPPIPAFLSGTKDFWVVDVAVNYRLPRRYGFVSMGIRDLFDRDETYLATDIRNPDRNPGRLFFAQVTLAIP